MKARNRVVTLMALFGIPLVAGIVVTGIYGIIWATILCSLGLAASVPLSAMMAISGDINNRQSSQVSSEELEEEKSEELTVEPQTKEILTKKTNTKQETKAEKQAIEDNNELQR